METFKDRLLSVLKEKNITGYQLAKDINISRATVSNYMSGKTTPNKLILHELSIYLRVDKDWLLEGKGNMIARDHMQKELSQFSDHEIVRYVADHADEFTQNPLFRSYVDVIAACRRAELYQQEHKRIFEDNSL